MQLPEALVIAAAGSVEVDKEPHTPEQKANDGSSESEEMFSPLNANGRGYNANVFMDDDGGSSTHSSRANSPEKMGEGRKANAFFEQYYSATLRQVWEDRIDEDGPKAFQKSKKGGDDDNNEHTGTGFDQSRDLQRQDSNIKARKSIADMGRMQQLSHSRLYKALAAAFTRSLSLTDQCTDLTMLVFLISHAIEELSGHHDEEHSEDEIDTDAAGAGFHIYLPMIYGCFLLAPYFVTATVLLVPITRKAEIELLSPVGVFIILLFPVYIVCMTVALIFVDLYLYTFCFFTDLATTRYFLYYWRLKVFSEIFFESIPQTVFVLQFALEVNPTVVCLSIATSVTLLLWNLSKVIKGGRQTGLGFFGYLKEYYIKQGCGMLPYWDAILQNSISDLSINKETLTELDWIHMTRALYTNYSIQSINVSTQRLTTQLWSLLFYALENNELRELSMADCQLFSDMNVADRPRRRSMSSLTTGLQMRRASTDKKDDQSANMFSPSFLQFGICRALQKSPNIEKLDLSGNELHLQFIQIMTTVSEMPYLTELTLSDNTLNSVPMNVLTSVFESIFRNCRFLEEIQLGNNGLTDEFAIMVASILTTEFEADMALTRRATANKSMSVLSLSPKLKKSNASIALDVNDVELSGKSGISAMDAVMNPLSIQLIELDGNQLTLKGATALLELSKKYEISFGFEGNALTDDEWMKLMGHNFLTFE